MALVVDIGVHARAGQVRIDVSVDEMVAGLYATRWQHSLSFEQEQPDDPTEPQEWLGIVLRPLLAYLAGHDHESDGQELVAAAADDEITLDLGELD